MTEPRQTTRPGGPEASAQPPRFEGWNGDYASPARGLPDLSPLMAVIDALRRMVPAELQDQFNALQRELLLTIRALIDWYLERLDARTRPPEVEDIPIE